MSLYDIIGFVNEKSRRIRKIGTYLRENRKRLPGHPFADSKFGKDIFKLFMINNTITGSIQKIKSKEKVFV